MNLTNNADDETFIAYADWILGYEAASMRTRHCFGYFIENFKSERDWLNGILLKAENSRITKYRYARN